MAPAPIVTDLDSVLEPPVPVVHAAATPVIEYEAPAPDITLAAPAPVVECAAPAHTVTFAAPSPVTEDVAPALSSSCAAPASVIEYVAPATPETVNTYVEPAPVIEDTVEVQITERIQEQIGPERIEDLIEEQFNVEDTTLNTVGTSSSSSTSTRCDELATMFDSCMQLLSPLTAHVGSIEKETERVAMLTERMLEPPMMEPPLMEPPMMESERASAKRRRRTRYTPLPGILENAVYLAPSTWPPARRA